MKNAAGTHINSKPNTLQGYKSGLQFKAVSHTMGSKGNHTPFIAWYSSLTLQT